jgi:hypothetical protein
VKPNAALSATIFAVIGITSAIIGILAFGFFGILNPRLPADELFKILGAVIAGIVVIAGWVTNIVVTRATADLTKDVELYKNKLIGKALAYDKLLSSAHKYYSTLARISITRMDRKSLTLADQAAIDAQGVLWRLPDEERKLWYNFYQLAMNAADLLAEAPPDGREAIWNEHARELGAALKSLEDAGLQAIERRDALRAAALRKS